MAKPFKVESADINKLSDIQLTQLLKELLHSEAFHFGIAQRAVEVSLNIITGDGGEDGRISWEKGPASTDYIPNRLTLFQNKATDMGPAAYGKEILTDKGLIKPIVEQVLDEGGSYVVFTTQELNTKQKKERIKKIRESLAAKGKSYAETCDLQIYDSSQIAGWVNKYISAIVAVQHWGGRPVERGLKTYALWSEHEDLSRLPFAAVASRSGVVEQLKKGLITPKACFRVVGLSGLGKTRTAFQVFSEDEVTRNLVVYVDANHAPNIDALVADWVSLDYQAIIVVDNCEYRLHERLIKEVRRENSKISLLTLDYNFDSISAPTVCFKLEQMTDGELLQLLSPVYSSALPDLDRIVGFAQGFPQMAVLLAEARLNEDPRIGFLTEDELARKLLWGRNEVENPEHLKILQACSLFDVFGIEKEAECQLSYISEVAGVHVDDVFSCIQEYSSRGLIDRRGRFGQVVPKPLAIRLAGQWWTKTRENKQRELVDSIPSGMIEGFCSQVEKMDFHSDVKLLTEKLCGPQAPFGLAEVILSERGSRLFRSFVNVNPDATAAAIFRTLASLSHDQLLSIEGDTRRNLVWGLEKLCFHADLFMESSWCMLLLASAENESWSNNATGMFSQLFRINLSGTAAEPEARFSLLRQAMDINQTAVDMVLLSALEQAINTYGGSRTVGAEFQGTKAPLEEWRPEVWQEVFDYWQAAVDLYIVMLDRGERQKEKVLNDVGGSIRGFVSRGRIDMLDFAIRRIVESNGRYWPSALESIKNIFEYDSEGLGKTAVSALNSWLALLSPEGADLAEKLRIVVVNPPWEHRKMESGSYVDSAAENARSLALEIAKDVGLLLPNIKLLLVGDQRQSYSFGRQLILELTDEGVLLDRVLEELSGIGQANISFVLGLYRGLYEKSPGIWQDYIDRVSRKPELIGYYPSFICTGLIQVQHLNKLLDLIGEGTIPASSATALSYGSVTDGLAPEVVADFCLKLSALGSNAAWPALDVMFMYCFSSADRMENIRSAVKVLVLAVPLHKDQKESSTDFHHWRSMIEKLLSEPDEDFLISISRQLISACQHGFNHGDLWHYIKPLLLKIAGEHGDLLWPHFGEAISKAKGLEVYWLRQLLSRENSFTNQMPSVFSSFPAEGVISWCEEHPDFAPSFVASCVNVMVVEDDTQFPSRLFISLLENFGDDKRVASALAANMNSRGWSGSLVPYLERDKAALTPLLKHKNGKVSRWAYGYIDYIDSQIARESSLDAERDLGIF
ncbi:hypothetical protein E8F11_10490 [Pseudomonas sp. BN417]|uniref:hypothetical protein n=1 Tax=Pseudomonas sp. BN417 TaxID=2567890 RepID=UPI002458D34D|nr:hypothetical protein [Pseudomonas sp. BN417]MDH4555600.1 hypothetical protein [Pseudomonas sp. BN417]